MIGLKLAGGVVIGNAPQFDRIHIGDVDRMLTPRALGLGATPGAIEAPLGGSERDIDRRPSQGTRTHLVHVRDGEAEPSCAELHALPFPRL